MAPSKSLCSYVNCKRTRANNPDVSFFRFPSNKERCEKWVERCGNFKLKNLNKDQLRQRTVCAGHFPDWNFMNKLKNSLVHNAAPVHHNPDVEASPPPSPPESECFVFKRDPNLKTYDHCVLKDANTKPTGAFEDVSQSSQDVQLEEDMENFMEWKIMGCKKKMKKDAVPHKFSCQTNEIADKLRKITKRRKIEIIQDVEAANDLMIEVITDNHHIEEGTQEMQDIQKESDYFDEYEQRVADQPQENEDVFEEKPLICEDSKWVENGRTPTADLNVVPVSLQRLSPNKRRLSEVEQQCLADELAMKEYYHPPYTPEDRFDVFGKTVAIKLRELPRQQMLMAEKLINDVLFQAEMGNLTLSHKLVVETIP